MTWSTLNNGQINDLDIYAPKSKSNILCMQIAAYDDQIDIVSHATTATADWLVTADGVSVRVDKPIVATETRSIIYK